MCAVFEFLSVYTPKVLYTVVRCHPWPVASPRGMGGSGPPTYVQTPPEKIRWKVFLYIGWGYPMHIYCNFYCSPAKKYGSEPLPPTFLGWRRHCPWQYYSFLSRRCTVPEFHDPLLRRASSSRTDLPLVVATVDSGTRRFYEKVGNRRKKMNLSRGGGSKFSVEIWSLTLKCCIPLYFSNDRRSVSVTRHIRLAPVRTRGGASRPLMGWG